MCGTVRYCVRRGPTFTSRNRIVHHTSRCPPRYRHTGTPPHHRPLNIPAPLLTLNSLTVLKISLAHQVSKNSSTSSHPWSASDHRAHRQTYPKTVKTQSGCKKKYGNSMQDTKTDPYLKSKGCRISEIIWSLDKLSAACQTSWQVNHNS